MFHDRHTTRGRQQCGARRDIQTPGRVPARAYDIDRAQIRRNMRTTGEAPHGPCESPDFVRNDALGPQGCQYGPHHRGRACRIRQMREQPLGLRLAQMAALEQDFEQLTRSGHVSHRPRARDCARLR